MHRLPHVVPTPRRSVIPLLILLALLGACGPADPVDVCGLEGTAPTEEDVPNGFGDALRDDEPFRERGTWTPIPQANIDIGTLSLTVPFDETGTAVSDLIARRAFPICVRLGERGERVGAGNLVDGGYITDATHTGAVAILGEVSGLLTGRFEVHMRSPSRGTDTRFTDGAFRLERR